MYKLLLVEDEKWIRLGLKAMLDLGRYGIDKVLEAADGEQGFALFLQHRPHIVISDVRLPGMDGCTMCEKIYREVPGTKIIMLSGYNEFEYARRALAYHAVDYLLKPVDRQLLGQVVEQCVRALDRAGAPDGADGLPALCTALAGEPGDNELHRRLAAVVRQRYGIFYDFILLLAPCLPAERAAVHAALARLSGGPDAFRDSAVFPLPSGEVGMLVLRQYNLMGRKSIAAHALEALQPVCADPCVVVSDFYDIMQQFAQALSQVRDLLRARQPGERVLMRPESGAGSDMAAFYHYRKGLIEGIKMRSGEQIQALADGLLADLAAQRRRPQLLRVVLTGLVGEIGYKFLEEDGGPQGLWDRVSAANRALEGETSPEEMVRMVTGLALSLAGGQPLQGDAGDSIAEAVRYIDEHYHQKLTLRGLAEEYHMSETYFSALFKKTVGVPLTQYITDLRIARAKELLARTDRRVSEVANLVGYPDQHYFTKVFKRVTGQNPTDYKQGEDSAGGEGP